MVSQMWWFSARFQGVGYLAVTSQGGRMSRVLASEDCGFEFGTCGFETWSSQTNDFKTAMSHTLAWRSALLA